MTSRYHAQNIEPPNPQDLEPFKGNVRYDRRIDLAIGLDPVINLSDGIFVCANNHVGDTWFQCRSLQAAAEVLKPYYDGEYLSLKWFTKKS